MKLICITGIDGAGKTTLARKLVEQLRHDGYDAKYYYGRIFPITSRLVMALGRFTLLRTHNSLKNYPAYNSEKKQVMRNPILIWIYAASVLLDYYFQIWIKLLPYLFSNDVIVLDRYVYDTVISDLAVHLNLSCSQTSSWIKHGLILLPKPKITFLIDLPESVAFSRKKDVPHMNYLIERRPFYKELQKRPEVELCNGENPFELLMSYLYSRTRNVVV